MSEIIQWGIVIAAVAISAIFLARKFKRQAKGKCDGCCERCSMYARPTDCESYSNPPGGRR